MADVTPEDRPTAPFEAPLDSPELTILEHLDELRRVILHVVGAVVVGGVAGWFLAEPAIRLLEQQSPQDVQFIQLQVGEVFWLEVQMAIGLGLCLTLPYSLFHIIRFVAPGLHRHEKRLLWLILIGGSLLFVAGVLFGYLLLLPMSLGFLVGFGEPVAHQQLSVSAYIGFCASLVLLCGAVFELPVVLFGLAAARIVSSDMLIRKWREAMILCVIAAAVITPGQDPFSLMATALPLAGLYIASIVPIRLFLKR